MNHLFNFVYLGFWSSYLTLFLEAMMMMNYN